jgi:hypothetical protein
MYQILKIEKAFYKINNRTKTYCFMEEILRRSPKRKKRRIKEKSMDLREYSEMGRERNLDLRFDKNLFV